MIDYFEFASGLIALCSSLVPFVLAARIFKTSRSLFLLSGMLGLALLVHGVYRVSDSWGESFTASELEFLSSLLVFGATVWYTYLRRVKLDA